MKSKYMFWLLLVGLLGLVLILAACDQTTEPNDGVRTIPHSLKLGSANCITCHTGGLHAVPADHTIDEYPLETCSLPACHAESDVAEPVIPTVTTHAIAGAYIDCMVCHATYKTYEFPDTTEHTIPTNNVCLKCHDLPVVPEVPEVTEVPAV